jgi:hypothetical protein
VYRIGPDASWVLKKTAKRIGAARAVAAWTRALSAAGVRTVSPEPGLEENPLLQDEACWVIYPFIAGEPYRGLRSQILAAGALLGRIHAFGMGEDRMSREDRAAIASALRVHAELPDPIEPHVLSNDLVAFEETFRKHAPDLLPIVNAVLEPASERYTEHTLPALRGVSFPTVIGTWDFKASNLVYEKDDRPVLIDPDNAGVLPRIFDLAISVVLFHNFDAAAAPRRTFDADEWQTYRDAYLEHVTLTTLERKYWPTVLSAAWIDEGLHALRTAEEQWANPDVRPWLESLLSFQPERFPLD